MLRQPVARRRVDSQELSRAVEFEPDVRHRAILREFSLALGTHGNRRSFLLPHVEERCLGFLFPFKDVQQHVGCKETCSTRHDRENKWPSTLAGVVIGLCTYGLTESTSEGGHLT